LDKDLDRYENTIQHRTDNYILLKERLLKHYNVSSLIEMTDNYLSKTHSETTDGVILSEWLDDVTDSNCDSSNKSSKIVRA
jgi:hypothetical protein